MPPLPTKSGPVQRGRVDTGGQFAEKDDDVDFSLPDLTMPFARLHGMLWTGAALLALAAGLVFAGAAPALADLRVCNATQNLVGVAIGYRAREGWISEGWWRIEASSCTTLISGPLQSRYYYLYAEDATRGGRWDGPVQMCVADEEFKIVGVNDCFARGFQRAGFQEHDTGEQENWMVQLTDGPATDGSAVTGTANP